MKFKQILITLMLVIGLLVSVPVFSANKSADPNVPITFAAKDGYFLAGSIRLPKTASVNKKVPLVIFLHPLGMSKVSWGNVPYEIIGENAAILMMDLRGHGKSIYNKNQRIKYWSNFPDSEYLKFPTDIINTISFIKQTYPEIDVSRTAIIASDISANAAIIAASKQNTKVKNLILLSPTLNYKGLVTPIPLVAYGKHPFLILVSSKDGLSYNNSVELMKYAQGEKQIKIYPNGGNGINLIKFKPDSVGLIREWLVKTGFVK